MTAPEFSRPERLDRIGSADRTVALAATPTECAALARRFGLRAVESLTASLTLSSEAAGVRVRGRVLASVVQPCSVTGNPLTTVIDEPVTLIFASPLATSAAELELSNDSIDLIFHDGHAIDLGETAAETMALALDPFPRGPDADLMLRQSGVLSEGDAGPFGVLAALLKPSKLPD